MMKSPNQIFTKAPCQKLKSLTMAMLPLIYFGMSQYVTAATVYWDGADTTSGNGSPIGGSGNWNTSANWTNDAVGTTNQAWVDGDDAVFGGAGGTVTLDSAQTVGDITFTTDGYTLISSQAVIFANPVNSYTVTNAGDTATIQTTVGMSGGISPNALTKLGDGKLILAGSKNYFGDTTISAGILESRGLVVGANIINNSTYIANVGINQTSYYFSNMSGSGDLVKSGGGTLVLSNSNIYTGRTTINDGTLETRNLSALGNNSAVSVNNGALVVDSQSLTIGSLGGTGGMVDIQSGQTLTTGGDNTSTAYNGVILGSGQLTKQGAGSFTLTGNNTYSGITTISAGTLQIGDGGTTGLLGTGDVINNSSLIFNRSDASSYAGEISGTGAVTKQGTGLFNLTGTNTYTGATTVNAGTLSVNGSISSITTVNSGGTLGGTGTIGDIFINGGTFAPGNSIGTINVSGNVDFSGGGNYDLEVDAAGNSDKIIATGSATLTSGLVNVKAAPGTYAYSTDYTILTAAGGLGGTKFDSVNADLAFLTPTLSYDTDNVFLKLTRNDVSFNDVASTHNQQAVARALDSNVNGLSSLVSQITPLSNLTARQAFDSLSGVQHSNNQLITRSVSSQFNKLLLNHGSQSASSSLAFNAQSPNSTGYNSGSAFKLVQARGWWTHGFASFNDIDDTHNARGADYRTSGLAFGIDADWNDFVIGVAGSYAQTDIDPYSGNSTIDSYQAATYGSWKQDQLYVNASLGLGLHKVDASRTVIMGSSVSTAKADYDSFDINATIEAGKDFALNAGTALTPFAGVSYLHNTRDSFNEKGAGATNLSVDKENAESLLTSIGVRLSHDIQMTDNRILTPAASIAYVHEHIDSVSTLNANFKNVSGSNFSIDGPELDRDRLQLALGVTGQLTNSTSLVLGYTGEFADSHQNNTLTATVDVTF